MNIPLKKVTSSNINAIGYDEKRQLLDVQFNNGRLYRYENVHKHDYENLMKASSIGGYHRQNIMFDHEYYEIDPITKEKK